MKDYSNILSTNHAFDKLKKNHLVKDLKNDSKQNWNVNKIYNRRIKRSY